MAQTTNHLRDLLEKIKGDAQRALALLPSEAELRSLGWKCTACGHVKHFTRPVTAAVEDHCPKPILVARKYTFVQHLPGK